MADENTAINSLIHGVLAPKVERESHDELFWERNRANGRGQLGAPQPAPAPMFGDPEEQEMTVPVERFVAWDEDEQPTTLQPPGGVAGTSIAQGLAAQRAGAQLFSARGLGGDDIVSTQRGLGPKLRIDQARHSQQRPAATPPIDIVSTQRGLGRSLAGSQSMPTPTASQSMPAQSMSAASAQTQIPHLAAAPHAAKTLGMQGGLPVAPPLPMQPIAEVSNAQLPHVAPYANAQPVQQVAPYANAQPVQQVVPCANAQLQQVAPYQQPMHQMAPHHMMAPTAAGLGPHVPPQHAAQRFAGQHYAQPSIATPARTSSVAPALAYPEATARVVPLSMALPGARTFMSEFVETAKRFAAPLGILVIVAIFAGGFFAFNGQGGKKRQGPPPAVTPKAEPPSSAAEPPSSTTPTVTPIEPAAAAASTEDAGVSSSLSSSIAERIASVRATRTENTISDNPIVADEDAGVDIEMAPEKASRSSHSRTRRHRDRVAERADRDGTAKEAEKQKAQKREAEKLAKANERAKTDKRVAEAQLPANVANKTANATGKLTITSNVPAMVYLDGRATKMRTPAKFAVPAGPHKITLLEPSSKKAKTQDVEIVAGKSASVDKQF